MNITVIVLVLVIIAIIILIALCCESSNLRNEMYSFKNDVRRITEFRKMDFEYIRKSIKETQKDNDEKWEIFNGVLGNIKISTDNEAKAISQIAEIMLEDIINEYEIGCDEEEPTVEELKEQIAELVHENDVLQKTSNALKDLVVEVKTKDQAKARKK